MSSRTLALSAFMGCSIVAGAQAGDTAIVLSPEDQARLAGRLEEDRILRGPLFPSPFQRSLEIQASGFFDSDALYNDLILGLRRGGFITQEVRERSQAALKDENRLGQELEGRVTFIGADGLFGRARWRPVISAAYHNLLGARFTDDAYDLTFFGNAGYEADTAVLAPSAHEQQVYQTLGFGIADAWTTSFIRLDLVNGQYMNAVDLNTAELHTAVDGRVIDATVDGRYLHSDTAVSGLSAGVGLALSGRWMAPFTTMGMHCHYFIELQDLGFIRWNYALALRKDSTTSYEGIEVENIFDLSELVISDEDLLDTLGFHAEQRTIVLGLPWKISAGIHLPWNERWATTFTLDQRDLPAYALHADVRVAWRAFPDLLLDAGVSSGGFGGPRVGFGTAFDFGDHLRLTLRCDNVIGTTNEEARGMAAFAEFSVFW